MLFFHIELLHQLLAGLAKHGRANVVSRKEYESRPQRVRGERRKHRSGQIGPQANRHGSGHKCVPKRHEYPQ